MKKSVKLLSLLAMLAGFSTVASAEGVFVGGSLDAQHSKLSASDCDADDGDCSISGGRMGLGLKSGYDFGQFRVYGAYQYNLKAKEKETETSTFSSPNGTWSNERNYEYAWQNHNLTVGADYTPSFTDNFKGLVGGYLGYSHLKLKEKYSSVSTINGKVDYSYSDTDSVTSNGFVYGLRLGGIYSFNQNNELEFGVKAEQARYKRIDEDNWDFKPKTTNYGAFVGYNYKF